MKRQRRNISLCLVHIPFYYPPRKPHLPVTGRPYAQDQLRKINQMEREMCQYPEYELNVDPVTLRPQSLKETVKKDFFGSGCRMINNRKGGERWSWTS